MQIDVFVSSFYGNTSHWRRRIRAWMQWACEVQQKIFLTYHSRSGFSKQLLWTSPLRDYLISTFYIFGTLIQFSVCTIVNTKLKSKKWGQRGTRLLASVNYAFSQHTYMPQIIHLKQLNMVEYGWILRHGFSHITHTTLHIALCLLQWKGGQNLDPTSTWKTVRRSLVFWATFLSLGVKSTEFSPSKVPTLR